MQLKRFFAILLAATLIFSVAAVPASAENTEILKVGVVAETTAPISTSPLIVNQGEEVSVKVSVEENTGVNFLRFALYFDANAFEYVSHSSSDLLGSGSIQVKDNYLIFFATGETVSTKTGELFTVTFVAKEFCGNAEFTAKLAQGRESNCCKLGSGSSKVNVPFVSNTAEIIVHSINAEEGVVTAPTCEGEGYTTYTCKACEQAVVGNIVAPTGHTPGKWAIENKVDATCTELGSYDEVQYCDVCFAELVRNPVVVPAFGHTAGEAVEENRVEATCTADGSYDVVVYCTVCNAELSRETIVIPATGHSFGETVIVPPTGSTEGYSEHTCEVCGFSEKFDFVPALNYVVSGNVESFLGDGDITIELVKDGEVAYTVIVNGTNVSFSIEGVVPGTYTMVVSKENHVSRSYEVVVTDGDVTADAKICPMGDVTGDGVVNIKDFQRLLRHVNKTNPLF